MARFGLLTLNEGNWNGTPILSDTTYFDQMTTSAQTINPSYGYLWWLNGKATHMLPRIQLNFSGSVVPNGPNDAIMALGKNGQMIHIVPSQNLVWIRMGNSPDNSLVPNSYANYIWEKINQLNCLPLSQ
jgi:CubicO group peptidase (beta-lactamase class C family)